MTIEGAKTLATNWLFYGILKTLTKEGVMKLYYSKGACSMSIRITAHELGLKMDYESVDLGTKKTATGQDFWHINSKGSVPTLITAEKQQLTENIAILQYLADTHPSSLLPKIGDFSRYRVLEWLSFMATDFHKAFSPLFNHTVPQDMKDAIFIPLLKKKVEYLNQSLKGKTYLTGETFTLPDAYCFVTLRWLAGNKIALSDYPDLQRYFNQVADRESVKAALKEELG